MTDKVAALQALTPNAQWVLRGDELEWLDTEQTQPTDSAIAAKIVELHAHVGPYSSLNIFIYYFILIFIAIKYYFNQVCTAIMFVLYKI